MCRCVDVPIGEVGGEDVPMCRFADVPMCRCADWRSLWRGCADVPICGCADVPIGEVGAEDVPLCGLQV